MRAMRDELTRSMTQLQFENLEKPYFISYLVTDNRSQSVAAQFGSALGRGDSRSREVAIEVRVGSPALDNTNFGGFGGGGGGTVRATFATDDNYDVLRRQLWLTTDRAYKAAVEQLARKKAALQNKTRTEELPDFSPQPPTTLTDLRPGKPIDLDQAEALVRELSALFREASGVANSNVALGAQEETARYVNIPGLLAWFVGMRLLRMTPGSGGILDIWDAHVIPRTRRFEARHSAPFGQSVFAVARVPGTPREQATPDSR